MQATDNDLWHPLYSEHTRTLPLVKELSYLQSMDTLASMCVVSQ